MIAALVAIVAAIPLAAWTVGPQRPSTQAADVAPASTPHVPTNVVEARRQADFAAMKTYRPGYAFWQHVFTMPDGRIAYAAPLTDGSSRRFPRKVNGRATRCGPIPRSHTSWTVNSSLAR